MMAENFESVPSLNAISAPSPHPDVSYFSELYITSLSSCDEYLAELHKHVDLLYGSAMADQLNALRLHERNKRLIRILLQLCDVELLAPIDAQCFLRLLNIDLLKLLNCTELNCDGIIRLSEQVDAERLDSGCESIRFLYGVDVECDFHNLTSVLMRTGSSLVGSVRDILSNKYGSYYEWRQTVVTLESKLSKGRLPRDDIWSMK